MPRNLILHIGPMKTGSTSIQFWLHQRAKALAAHGYHVGDSLGKKNHSRLAILAQSLATGREQSQADGARIAALTEEIKGLDDSVHTVIFSGEMMGQTLNQLNEVKALKELFDPLVDSFTIVVYLRRQDELSVSRYSTALRRGEKRARPLANPLDYELLLALWSQVFGRENIRPRMFTRDALVGGDAVRDFAEAVDLPYEPTEEAPIDRNPSLLPKAQAFLAEFAQRVRDAGYPEQFVTVDRHEEINRILNETFSGKGAKPARRKAIAYYDQVRESNERVRAAWFPERETLFPEDFTSYPIEAEPDPSPSDQLDVAMAVLTGLVIPKQGSAKHHKTEKHEAMVEMRREKRRLRKMGEANEGGRKPEDAPRNNRKPGRRMDRANRL